MALGHMRITSPAFEFGQPIPARHAQEGDDVSPPLSWTGLPEGVQELVLVCHDPDAPRVDGFTHWVVYGIDPGLDGLAEGQEAGVSGLNGYGEPGYRGPNPPEGHGVHSYYFQLIALDTRLRLEEGLSLRNVRDRVKDHVLEVARLVGTYSRELQSQGRTRSG